MAKRTKAEVTELENKLANKSVKQRLIDIARPGKREQPRPVRDVRTEIEELTEEEARLNRQRDDLISELARDLTGPNADNLTRQIGDLDIRLGAVRRRKEWNRRDLYQSLIAEGVEGYRQAYIAQWTASYKSDQAAKALRKAREEAKRMVSEAELRYNQAVSANFEATRARESFFSTLAQQSGLPESEWRQLLLDIEQAAAPINAEYGGGRPEDWTPEKAR